MLNKLVNKTKTEENIKKDFKKLATYIITAKGYDRTINGFAADLKSNAEYLADLINARACAYPPVQFLKLISDNSEGRVTLKELTMACGYSNYTNNDLEQIKNIQVKRGFICYANFGDKAIDSEIGGHRPVLIIQNNTGNHFSSNSIVLAITSRKKTKLPTHVFIGKECGLPFDSTISCELPNTISKRRLLSNTGTVEILAECPQHILKLVEVALLKSQGIINLRMDDQEAIEYLENMNTAKTYQFENNHDTNRQHAFA